MKALQFNDFTGGLTDKSLPGQHNMYTKADNLLIEHDRSLYSRDGFDILSSTGYQLSDTTRVARLINFDYNTELLAVQGKQLQYLSAGVWTNLLGPTTNKAFNSNIVDSLISEAQWNHHLFLASNSGDPVVKYYRDGSGNAQVRTAGLPKPLVTNIYQTTQGINDVNDPLKLATLITLAVDIKTQLQAHINDYGVSPAAHLAKDTTNYDLLNALSAPTDLASLKTYTSTIRTAYNSHVADARLSKGSQNYHIGISSITTLSNRDPILNILTSNSLPTTPATYDDLVRVLNEIRNIYTFHSLAPITHNNATQISSGWGAHFISTPQIDIYQTSPQVLPNINTFLNYVNFLKAEYNNHAGNTSGTGFYHQVADSSNLLKIADASDLCTGIALLGCLYFHYGQHIEKANAIIDPFVVISGFYESTQQLTYLFKGTITAGSATITSVSPDPTVYTTPAITGFSVVKLTDDVAGPTYTNWQYAPLFPAGSIVSSVTSTTIVMDHVAAGGSSGTFTLALHWNGVHSDAERSSGAVLISPSSSKLFLSLFDPSLRDLNSCKLLATTIAGYLKSHEISGYTEMTELDFLSVSFYFATQPIPEATYYKDLLKLSSSEFIPPNILGAGQYSSKNFYPSLTATGSGFGTNKIANKGVGYFEAGLNVTSYLYQIIYKYNYSVGAVQFTDESEPSNVIQVNSFVSPSDASSGSTTWSDYIGIAGITPLANASNQNWGTANIKTRFYRTIGGGSSYYLAKEVTNATTGIQDFMDDTNLVLAESLYTNGGIVGNGLPPVANYIHVLDNRMYYAKGRTLWQSLSDDPDSVPLLFTDTFEEDITGLSSTRSNLVVFTAQNVYRVDGFFDELGQGFMRHEKIFDTTGCIAPYSPVKTDVGIFFLGKNGVYYTDGYQAFRVSYNHDTFTSYVAATSQQNAVQGVYNQAEKKIYWTIKTTSGATNPNIISVFDIHFGIKVDAVPNTQFSGGFDGYSGFTPTAICVYNDLIHFGDSNGFVIKQTPGVYLDRFTNIAPYRAMLWNYKSCNEDFGSPNFRKYFVRLNTEFQQTTNLSVQISSDADKGKTISDLPIIRSRKLLDWGDPKIDWTSSVYTARSGGVIDEFRRFKSDGSLRSNYRAIEMKNAYCVIAASNQMGNINVTNISANVWELTLINSGIKWPLYSIGYFVRINSVDYPITVRTSDSVVRVNDTGLLALSVQANIPYEIWGYPKNERVNLNNFDINYEFLGQMQKDYGGTTSTDGGQNAP